MNFQDSLRREFFMERDFFSGKRSSTVSNFNNDWQLRYEQMNPTKSWQTPPCMQTLLPFTCLYFEFSVL